MEKLRYYILFILGKLRQHFFMQYPQSERDWVRSRLALLVHVAADTAIVNLVGGAFLASLMRILQISDALNGVFSGIPTIAVLSQVVMLQITRRIKKAKLPTALSYFTARAMQGIMLFMPFVDMPLTLKTAVFLSLYIAASFLLQFASPLSTEWMISLFPAGAKGQFISIKDTVYMISGGVFSLVGAGVLDSFTSAGNQKKGFIIIALIVFALVIIQFIAFNIMKEPKKGNVYISEDHEAVGRRARSIAGEDKKTSIFSLVADALKNAGLRKVIYIYIFWNLLIGISTPFLNIYHISELGLSYTFINAMMLVAKVICAFMFPMIGKLADRISFLYVTKLGVFLTALCFISGALCMPGSFSKVAFIMYQIFYFTGTGIFGIGIASILYTVIPTDDAKSYIAVSNTSNAMFHVGATFAGGVIMDYLQKKPIVLGGVMVYAQQVLCTLSAVIVIMMLVFLKTSCSQFDKNQ